MLFIKFVVINILPSELLTTINYVIVYFLAALSMNNIAIVELVMLLSASFVI